MIIYFFMLRTHIKNMFTSLRYPTCSKIKRLRYQVVVYILRLRQRKRGRECHKLTCPKPEGDAHQFRRTSEGGPVMGTSIFSHSYWFLTALRIRIRIRIRKDPYVFGPSGSGFISQIYGSRYGSFSHQAKIVRNAIESYCFVTSV
jgi:hypothetical protein